MLAENRVNPEASHCGIDLIGGAALCPIGMQDRCCSPRDTSSLQPVVNNSGAFFPGDGQVVLPAPVAVLPHEAKQPLNLSLLSSTSLPEITVEGCG